MFPEDHSSRYYIKRLLICETIPYHEQYFRPYQVSATADVINDIQNNIMMSSETNIPTSAIATFSSQIVMPSAAPSVIAPIVNGWSEKRFRFLMEVVWENSFATTSEIISGYTDHLGYIDQNGRAFLDPHMDFYINSLIPINIVSQEGRYGRSFNYHIESANNPISTFGMGDQSGQIFNMSPMNVASNMMTKTWDNHDAIWDGATSVRQYPSLSNISNANSLRYTGKMLNTFREVGLDSSVGYGGIATRDAFGEVRGRVHEHSFTNDKFIALLGSYTGDPNRTHFTWQELQSIDPNVVLDEVTKVLKRNQMNSNIDVMGMNHVAGANYETIMAVNISNILPSLMLDYGITSLSFSSTNSNIGGQTTTLIESAQSFSTAMDLTPYLPAITSRINQELIPVVSMQNQQVYTLSVACELMGSTMVQISFNGGPMVPYIIPTFASSVFLPTLTTDYSDLDKLSRGMSGIWDVVNDALDMKFGSKSTSFNHINATPNSVYDPGSASSIVNSLYQ